MVLKTKLTWGLGFLFFVIFTLGAFCSYYVEELGQESDNILKDNYNSIVYAKRSGLDDMKTSITSAMYGTGGARSDYAARFFESGRGGIQTNLKAENNITETRKGIRRDP